MRCIPRAWILKLINFRGGWECWIIFCSQKMFQWNYHCCLNASPQHVSNSSSVYLISFCPKFYSCNLREHLKKEITIYICVCVCVCVCIGTVVDPLQTFVHLKTARVKKLKRQMTRDLWCSWYSGFGEDALWNRVM
jgi:hypothetical protein